MTLMTRADHNPHEYWMAYALSLARSAATFGEVPVGCIIVRKGLVVGSGYNLRETRQCATAHAEILAIEDACQHLGGWRLDECTVYVTLEPCVMCAGALQLARISQLVFGASDQKSGAIKSLYQIHQDSRLNHRYLAQGDVLATESATILREFFQQRRHS